MNLEAAYALAVAGAAMIWPPLALLVAAVFLGSMAILHWRMSGEDAPPAEQATTPEAQP